MSGSYIPGTCNIGSGEIRRRQLVALIGVFLIISTATTLIATDQSRTSRLSIFLPAMIFSIGYIQATSKFCLAYGLAGTFNFDRLGKISRVESSENRQADRKTATKILVKSFLLAVTITLIFFVIPL